MASSQWTETSDTDFADGIVSSVTIVGTGDAAYIRISTTQATGGTITYSGGYTIHTFTSNGTFTPNSAMNVEYLVVAGGGGGGGSFHGGGGGAGGLIYSSAYSASGNITVTVGGGGAGGVGGGTGPSTGTNGQNSVFGTITSSGGGGGGSATGHTPPPVNGKNGGSGGGAGIYDPNVSSPGTGIVGQGNNGGTATNGTYYGTGGGGGAGAVGGNGTTTVAGNGGVGLYFSQFTHAGSPSGWFAGGGGGSTYSAGTPGTGGSGGGGTGSITQGTNGTANTGGGGGGSERGASQYNGGSGGSGIVIVRYPTIQYFSTGTYKSNVLDTASKVVVSSVSWNPASQPSGTNIAVGIRVSSYPFSINSSTPSWLAVSNGQTLNWHGRYIQYQSTFTTTSSTTTPRLEDISVTYRVKPWQEKSVTRTPPNSFGFGGGETWIWQVPVKSGSALTITAYIRYNTEYGGSTTKPKLTLSGAGISPTSISATSSAENAWELLTINPGTPSQNATLTLKTEGFSVTSGAKFYIDDINVSQ